MHSRTRSGDYNDKGNSQRGISLGNLFCSSTGESSPCVLHLTSAYTLFPSSSAVVIRRYGENNTHLRYRIGNWTLFTQRIRNRTYPAVFFTGGRGYVMESSVENFLKIKKCIQIFKSNKASKVKIIRESDFAFEESLKLCVKMV